MRRDVPAVAWLRDSLRDSLGAMLSTELARRVDAPLRALTRDVRASREKLQARRFSPSFGRVCRLDSVNFAAGRRCNRFLRYPVALRRAQLDVAAAGGGARRGAARPVDGDERGDGDLDDDERDAFGGGDDEACARRDDRDGHPRAAAAGGGVRRLERDELCTEVRILSSKYDYPR